MKYDPEVHTHPSRPSDVSHFEQTVFIACPPEKVLNFCLHGENFQKILPFGIEPAHDLDDMVGRAGHVYPFNMKAGPARMRWEAYVEEKGEHHFVDVMLKGPMRWWRHTHRVEPAPGGCLYTDSVAYRTHLGASADNIITRRLMRRFFSYRQKQMKSILERGGRS